MLQTAAVCAEVCIVDHTKVLTTADLLPPPCPGSSCKILLEQLPHQACDCPAINVMPERLRPLRITCESNLRRCLLHCPWTAQAGLLACSS